MRSRYVQAAAALAMAIVLAVPAAAQQATTGKPLRDPDVIYVPTPQEVVDAMLTMANVTGKDVVYDLGSGDGRIPITAAQKYGARGVGIDINPERIKEAEANLAKANVGDKVKFLNQDLFETDISQATVVTLYLLPIAQRQTDADAEEVEAWNANCLAQLRHGERLAAGEDAGRQRPHDLLLDDQVKDEGRRRNRLFLLSFLLLSFIFLRPRSPPRFRARRNIPSPPAA